MLDFLIIGQGFAGTALAHYLEERNLSFHIIDESRSSTASKIASGLYNPVVLKRLKAIWKANEMMDEMNSFYPKVQNKLNGNFIAPEPILRLFNNEQELNDWQVKSDHVILKRFLNDNIARKGMTNGLIENLGVGTVKETGRINPINYLKQSRDYFEKIGHLSNEKFQQQHLKMSDGFGIYKELKFKKIIFCDGLMAAQENPYFSWLPFSPTKGELLIIKAPNLNLTNPIHSKFFILPLGDDLYKIGATYGWNDLTLTPTKEKQEELEAFVETNIKLPYEIVDIKVGIRPNTKDRRPFLGNHPKYKNIYIMNGLGSRGALMSPWLAKTLIDYSENEIDLPAEIDINRYLKYFANPDRI